MLRQPPAQLAELHNHLATLAAQAPEEREHLTAEAFAERFGARPEDIAAVRRFAYNNGLHVIEEHPGKRIVRLGGTIRALSRAFGVRVELVRTAVGIYRVPVGRVRVPAWLDASVDTVLGFDTRPIARPHFRYFGLGRVPVGQNLRPGAAAVTFDPPEVANLYQFPAGTDGQGQTVALIELGGGYRQADLEQYFQRLGVPMPQVEAVGVDGGSNQPTGNPNSADGEVELDVEMVGSTAPKATIAVYFAPNTDKGFVDAVLAAVHDTQRRPSVISISWGGPEEGWPAGPRRSMNQALQAASAIGITVFVAAGDSGSSDGVPGGLAHVDFPASSPLAVGCGGTALSASGGRITNESVWNDVGDGATGGGVSRIFPVPPYQASINPTSANPGGIAGRGVPDVAGDASPVTGYNVLVDGQAMPIGGTSAVAPLWAALLSRIQQQMGHSAAPILPGLYAAPQAFRDITIGTNGAYPAKVGWDACTGLGSPNGAAIADVLSQKPAVVAPAPPSPPSSATSSRRAASRRSRRAPAAAPPEPPPPGGGAGE